MIGHFFHLAAPSEVLLTLSSTCWYQAESVDLRLGIFGVNCLE